LAAAPFGVVGVQAQTTTPVDMCIARWKGAPGSYPDEMKTLAAKLTEQAVATLGGMGRFVKRGDMVWVKPNIAWDRTPEFAANTNPDVVATLVRLCLEAGAKKVRVGDKACNEAKKSYPASGIESAVQAVGGEIVYLDDSRFKEVALKGKRLDKWPLYPDIIECDLVINVPIVKHHSISTMTACMKNYMGVIGGERGLWHQEMATCLCDITAYMKPRLSVIDAIRILKTNGPTGGNLNDVKRMDTLAAGVDVVALDAFGAEMLGHKPETIKMVKAAHEAGLGQIDYRKLALREIEVA
jgi:uncharacterized protein (DUF362 family)